MLLPPPGKRLAQVLFARRETSTTDRQVEWVGPGRRICYTLGQVPAGATGMPVNAGKGMREGDSVWPMRLSSAT